MADNKTKATTAPVADYMAAIIDEARRKDCQQLLSMMAEISGQKAVMWGTAIVGFGVHTYALSGGKTGEICALGFSSRKGDISVYGVAGPEANQDLLARLGRCKLGKGCLYIKRLSDLDMAVFRQLLADAVKRKLT